jgi:phosphate transport system substrate-binding protein
MKQGQEEYVSKTSRALGLIAGAASTVALAAVVIGGTISPVQAAAPRASVQLNGAGSTFIGPLMLGGWIPGYTKTHSSVKINYALTGSGQGISLWTAGTTDFAGSDALLSPEQENTAKSRCAGVTKLPATIGAVALIYNLPGVKTGLKLTPDVVAGIFLGQIHEWNDTRIARLNPGVKLPLRPIQVVHRSDGSGTTYITTHYLAAVSGIWNSKVGSGSTVAWPTGIGAAKSSGVSAAVGRTAGAISYVDLAYAIDNNLSYAQVQNKAGHYVNPSVAGASAAAASFAKAMPSDLQQVIVNSPAANAYPITGYSYIFTCTSLSGEKGKTLIDFLKYALTTGQMAAGPRYYGALPKNVQALDLAALNTMSKKLK